MEQLFLPPSHRPGSANRSSWVCPGFNTLCHAGTELIQHLGHAAAGSSSLSQEKLPQVPAVLRRNYLQVLQVIPQCKLSGMGCTCPLGELSSVPCKEGASWPPRGWSLKSGLWCGMSFVHGSDGKPYLVKYFVFNETLDVDLEMELVPWGKRREISNSLFLTRKVGLSQ